MSTSFDRNFGPGDPIEVDQVMQFADAINEIESGQAFFREDIGGSDYYVVDFSDPSHNGIDSLQDGMLIVFKANSDNDGPAELQVQGTGDILPSLPITKNGGSPLETGDIMENQMVLVVYNSENGGRFEMVGVSSGGSGSEGPEGPQGP